MSLFFGLVRLHFLGWIVFNFGLCRLSFWVRSSSFLCYVNFVFGLSRLRFLGWVIFAGTAALTPTLTHAPTLGPPLPSNNKTDHALHIVATNLGNVPSDEANCDPDRRKEMEDAIESEIPRHHQWFFLNGHRFWKQSLWHIYDDVVPLNSAVITLIGMGIDLQNYKAAGITTHNRDAVIIWCPWIK